MWVLSIWETKELICFCRSSNTRRVRYVPSHDKILFVLGLVRREFRCGSKVPTVGSFGIGREFRRFALNWLRSSLSWSYRTCPVFYRTCPICTTRGQLIVFKFAEGREFRHESGVPTVESSSMSREFRHLTYFNWVTCFSNLLRVGSSGIHREFRRLTTSL